MDDTLPIGNIDWIDIYGLDPKLKDSNNPKCDFSRCTENATQWFQVICCKEVYFMCTEHVNKVMYIIRTLPTGKGVTCKYCELVWDNLDFLTVPKALSLDGLIE